MNAQNNGAMAQEKFVVQVDAKIAKSVNPVDRKILTDAYLQLFSGFSWVNWTNKYSLGRAWQTALGQVEAFTKTKGDKNPAAKHLKNVYESHKPYWSRVIMTHAGRDNIINANDEQIKQLRAYGEQMIRAAMDKINLVLARYNERAEQIQSAQQEQEKPKPQAPEKPTPQEKPAPQMQMTRAEKPAVAKPAAEYATRSAAQPVQKSGAMAAVRDMRKQTHTFVQDKTDAVPMTEEQKKQPQKKQLVLPEKTETAQEQNQAQQPVVHHASKSVVQQVQQSGALPALRDISKSKNVTKVEEKPKCEAFIWAKKRMEISAQQRAQIQMQFQQRIQAWQIGQFKQNAA